MGEPVGQIIVMYVGFIIICMLLYRWFKTLMPRPIALVLLALLILSPFSLYVPVEIRTMVYASQFKDVAMETGFNLPVVYYKVLTINDNEAKVFVVEGEDGVHETGNYYWFTREEGRWVFAGRWQTVWTNLGGSASEFTVPPYF